MRAQLPVDKQFESLAKSYLDELPALSPVSATSLGDHRFDGKLDEVSPEARDLEQRFLRRYLDELGKLERSSLSRANQVDAALLEHQLRYDLWRLQILREWSWNPLSYTDLAGSAFYSLMAREFAPLSERLASVAERLEQLPRLLEQVRETLVPARVPRPHAETAVKQNTGVLGILDNMVEPRLGELDATARQRLERAIGVARAAINQHQQWLEQELLPAANGEFRIGRELYDRKLAFTLNTPLTREQILERAQSELRRIRAEMYDIAKEVVAKVQPSTEFPAEPSKAFRQSIIRAGLEIAYGDVPGRDEIVAVARKSLAETTKFVRDRDLITIPPDPIEIIIMPEFQRGVALAYCDAPGPLDVGQKTFYAVAPLPTEWTEKQVSSFLREYNIRSIHDLTIHEAMPGHFVQLAHANRYPSTLRAVLGSGPFVEGWAVYAEQMMADQGYLDGDPLMKLIAHKWYLRSIANAIIDQSVHAGSMTREQAMELMIEETFQEEREAAGKWVRAQLTSAQLATYFVGYLEHVELRREVERREGAQFSLKKYHDAVLSFGSPPVRYARALMLGLAVPAAE